MSPTARLRRFTLADLRRLTPKGHYMLRPHSPQADLELAGPLRQYPEEFALTPREHDAADALAALAILELRTRDIFLRAYRVRDIDAPDDSPGVTDEEQAEIDAFREVLRRAALVYARTIGDEQLIEYFQLRAEPSAMRSRASDLRVVAHRVGRDVLAPVVDRACAAVADSTDTAQVQAELERLARLPEKERPSPLTGEVTSGGVKWRNGGQVKTLTRKALGDRLRRLAQARTGAERRGEART